MTDTMRSLSTLATLLADNGSGAISPQDLRDAVLATLQPGLGEISITSAAATTLADTSTWVQVAGTYAEATPIANWDMTQSGRLYYTGAAARSVLATASVSMTCGSNDQVTGWAIAKNGTVLTPSIAQRKILTGADVGSIALTALASVTTGDYITVMCRNTTAANDVTAALLTLAVMDIAA